MKYQLYTYNLRSFLMCVLGFFLTTLWSPFSHMLLFLIPDLINVISKEAGKEQEATDQAIRFLLLKEE